MCRTLLLTCVVLTAICSDCLYGQQIQAILPPAVAGHVGPVPFPDEDTPQYAFEIRVVTAPEELLRQFRPVPTESHAPKEETDPFAGWDEIAADQAFSFREAITRLDTFQDSQIVELTEDQIRHFIRGAQSNVSANIMFGPKVTVFDGQTATIMDESQIPIVIERSGSDHQTALIAEGFKIHLRARSLEGGRVQADVKIKLSSLPNRHEIPVDKSGTLQGPIEQVCSTIGFSTILKADTVHMAVLPPPGNHSFPKRENRIALASRIVGLGKDRKPAADQIAWLVSVIRINMNEDVRSPEREPAAP